MTTYTLREAVKEDMLLVRPLHASSWIATYPNDEYNVSYQWVKERTDGWLLPNNLVKSVEKLEGILSDSSQFYRIAEKDGQVVGFVHAATNSDGSKELEAIYTAPNTFGTGLGAILMQAALDWVGDTPATLKVATYNVRAIQFYEKFGFAAVEGSDDFFAEVIPMITMKREGK